MNPLSIKPHNHRSKPVFHKPVGSRPITLPITLNPTLNLSCLRLRSLACELNQSSNLVFKSVFKSRNPLNRFSCDRFWFFVTNRVIIIHCFLTFSLNP
ncbi:hypothetical protein L1987_36234 [Smallanthus sonchifolius]|uniref:Uncharacterized protein n=1 Tax=Smallanthus sonchifolius TaxID=185202 RepID=A0ACB9HCN0_9ASTR|nr:hypothetical protein L1987_36234 [Smallanthus sonchifolius]